MAYNSPPLSGREVLGKGFTRQNEKARVAFDRCSWLVFTVLGAPETIALETSLQR